MWNATGSRRIARDAWRTGLPACLAALLCSGCGPAGRPAGYLPDAAPETADPVTPVASVSAPGASVATGLSGTEGAISPIPAFRGGDPAWRIEIQSVGDLRHEVLLTQGGVAMTGLLTYRPLAGTDGDGPFDLHGVVHAPHGDAPMRVHLQRGSCIDAAGAHAWAVRVDVDGQAPRDGCGELAM